MKYRKKPVVIEAVQFDGNVRCLDIFPFSEVGQFKCSALHGEDNYLEIPTLEGVMRAKKGDWIIKGINGEYYPCKPDIFEKTYEVAPINH